MQRGCVRLLHNISENIKKSTGKKKYGKKEYGKKSRGKKDGEKSTEKK